MHIVFIDQSINMVVRYSLLYEAHIFYVGSLSLLKLKVDYSLIYPCIMDVFITRPRSKRFIDDLIRKPLNRYCRVRNFPMSILTILEYMD